MKGFVKVNISKVENSLKNYRELKDTIKRLDLVNREAMGGSVLNWEPRAREMYLQGSAGMEWACYRNAGLATQEQVSTVVDIHQSNKDCTYEELQTMVELSDEGSISVGGEYATFINKYKEEVIFE